MTAKTNKTNGSAKKRLIPAAAMLLASAMALSSSTYAWFTMSREVEVSNIQMSATVPEDIQISLGTIGTATGTISTGEAAASLANGKGVLYAGTGEGAKADNGAVVPPTNDWDWSNLADISEYYQFGKLIPASSTNGNDIFFTPNANGVGKTIAVGAKFYQAADNLTGKQEKDLGIEGNTRTTSLAATLHAVNSKNGGYVNDTWSAGGTNKYTTSTGWDNTNDDGYYVDIPVWLRTSSSQVAELSVQAYVKPRNDKQQAGKTASEALYRAVRVAIIDVGNPTSGTTYETSGTTKNLIPIADAWALSENGTDPGSLTAQDNPFNLTTGNNILNWYGRTVASGASDATALTATTGVGENAKAAVASIATNVPTYGPAVIYNAIDTTAANRVVATLAGPELDSGGVKKSNYGVAHKIVVRVWLEGEDPDCWNETAGQDWSINLKFNNEKTAALSGYGGDDLSGVNEGAAPKQNNG